MSDIVDLTTAENRMQGALDSVRREFSTIRTGRASPSILDRIEVEAYGSRMPLRSVANVNVPEARLLTITPFDPGTIKAIERAIDTSDIGLNPQNDGKIIRLPIPELTEERRKDLVKVVRGLAEEGKVALRNIRRDTMHDLRELRDAGEARADDEHRAEDALQKLTDDKVGELDALVRAKEEEILEV